MTSVKSSNELPPALLNEPDPSNKRPPAPSILDLTNRVRRSDSHYFAIGDHADVWMGDLEGEPGKVVIKVLRGGSSGNRAWIDQLQTRLLQKGEVWHKFDHPNVARFYGFTFDHAYMPALVIPYYPNGNVVEYVKRLPEMPVETKLDIVREIAGAIRYLHEEFEPSVVHGDIRGANVLIDANNHPVLCDYGLAYVIVGSEFTSVKTAGTCRWAAPEITNPPELLDDSDTLYDNDEPVIYFTKESDVYAFAMTVLEVFSDQPPFSRNRNDSSVIFKVIDGTRCLGQSPTDRPSIGWIYNRLASTSEDDRTPMYPPSSTEPIPLAVRRMDETSSVSRDVESLQSPTPRSLRFKRVAVWSGVSFAAISAVTGIVTCVLPARG